MQGQTAATRWLRMSHHVFDSTKILQPLTNVNTTISEGGSTRAKAGVILESIWQAVRVAASTPVAREVRGLWIGRGVVPDP
jgi:hypothetical protein